LTAPVDIKETFEEQWYQDMPDMKRVKEKWKEFFKITLSLFRSIFSYGL
jgi:hypothetical protein